MVLYAIIAFILYGWIEFEAMAHVVDAIGGLLAFIGIFVTAMIGIHLLRSQSAVVMAQLRADIATGQGKSAAIASSLSLLVGAILMLIPGYVTDMMGLICFIPGIREIIGAIIAKRFHASMMANSARFTQNGFSGGFSSFEQDETQNTRPSATQKHKKMPSGEDIIEGEFEEKN